MKRLSLLFCLLCCVASVHAQDAKPAAKFTPTETQSLRLQLKKEHALSLQKDYQVALNNLQQAVADLNAEADKVKDENKWDPTKVDFNGDKLTFAAHVDPPKQPAPPPVPAPPPEPAK